MVSNRPGERFLINKDNEELIEGISLINQFYPNYSAEEMYDSSLKEYYSIRMLIKSIEKYGLLKELLKMLIFDYLIGNSDRHQNNWAIINKGNGVYAFSPLYDTSSSLCCYISEQEIKSCLGNDLNRFNSKVRTQSKSIVKINGKSRTKPTHEDVLGYICLHYRKEVKDFIQQVLLRISPGNIDQLLLNYSNALLSENRREFIKLFLLKKTEIMAEIFGRKET